MKPPPCLAARSATTAILARADWSAIRDTFHSAAEEVRVPVRKRRFLAWAAGIITNELQHGGDPLAITGNEKTLSAVANACAETARIPVASSSVRLACKIRSAVPKCSTSFRMREGPSPSVSASASQQRVSPEAGFAGEEFSVATFAEEASVVTLADTFDIVR